MKMTKKFLLGGAVLLAATIMFTGCKPTLGSVNIKYTDASFNSEDKAIGTASVKHKNKDDTYNRGMKLLSTPHKGMYAKIALNGLENNSDNPGVMGLVFGLKEHNDEKGNKLYDFYLVGIRNDKGKLRTYLSKYTNISEDQFDAEDFGSKKNATEGASEKEILKINTYDNYSRNENNKNMEVAIKINPKDDGSYTIEWFNADDIDCVKLAENQNLKKVGPESVNISNQITAAKIKNDLNLKIGFYANVYPKQTMTGKWYLADLEGNPIVVDYDDTVASPLFN